MPLFAYSVRQEQRALEVARLRLTLGYVVAATENEARGYAFALNMEERPDYAVSAIEVLEVPLEVIRRAADGVYAPAGT